MPVVLSPPATAGILLELDPASEGGGTPLDIADGIGTFLLQWDFPEPPEDPLMVETRDTEGERPVHNRHKGRSGTIVLRAIGTGANAHEACDAIVTDIEKKVQKIRAEGGTLKATIPSGKSFVLDLHSGSQAATLDKRWVNNARCELTLQFGARPYWRSEPILLDDHAETSTGVLVFTETGIKGSVPGTVKFVVDDDEGQAQRLVILGLQSRYYSSDATAALHYECESRTAMGGSATAVGATGASGSGSNVVRNTGLLTTPQAILSTQASGGGAHLSHIGTFRWWQRLYIPSTNTGTVSVQLEWGEGDFRTTTQNTAVEIPDGARGTWVLVDLGTVQMSKVVAGTQQWEGRVLASSTVIGDDIDLDRFILVPSDEGYGEVFSDFVYRSGTIVARDEFTGRTAGDPLGGTAAPAGGSWVTSGSATDFAAADAPTGEETMSRSTIADSGGGRFAILGSTNYTDTEVGVRARRTDEDPSPSAVHQRVIARWVDSSNYLHVGVSRPNLAVVVAKVVGGLATTLAYIPSSLLPTWPTETLLNRWFGLRLIVFSSGRGIAMLLDDSETVLGSAEFSDPDLATGGPLASGKPGFHDVSTAGTAITRYYDDFYATVPPSEPLAIAVGRSLEIRSDRAIRQDSTGALWVPAPYEGFYPQAPPAWLEGRSLRVLVANCRGPRLGARVWADPGLDDLSARLTYTPRHLNLPDA